MILVDTSVWIAHLRSQDNEVTRKLRRVADAGEILIGDIILLEILQGACDDRHAAGMESFFRTFDMVPMLDDELASKAARNCRHLRARGITVRKTIDMIIGTFCMEKGLALLHDDRDFDPMVEFLGLRAVPL